MRWQARCGGPHEDSGELVFPYSELFLPPRSGLSLIPYPQSELAFLVLEAKYSLLSFHVGLRRWLQGDWLVPLGSA